MKDGKFVVLYIDDDRDLQGILHIILEANGYKVVEAETTDEGVAKFQEVSPDFIIIDMMLEEFDSGIHLAKKLLALGNKAPTYLLSSIGDEVKKDINFAELGLSGVFQKPLDTKMLLSILKTGLKAQ